MNGYLRANERDDEFGIKEVFTSDNTSTHDELHRHRRIDSAQGVESVTRDVTLDPGWTFMGTVLGPDGQPLVGAWGIGLASRSNRSSDWPEVMKTAEFTVSQFNPHQPRPLLFQHPQKGLVGVAQPPKNKGESITVQLRPGATVTGRLVDTDGRPRPGVELVVWRRYKELAQPRDYAYFPPRPNKTDQQGRFRIEGLLPELRVHPVRRKRPSALGEGLVRERRKTWVT